MAKEERFAFEQELEGDPLLQQQLKDVEQLLSAIETAGLMDQMDAFHADLPKSETSQQKTTKVRKLSYARLAVAASIALLMGIALIWYSSRPSVYEKMFETHFYKDPGLPTTMSHRSNLSFTEAMIQYKRDNYRAALQSWEKLLLNSPNNDTLNYFIGVSHLAGMEAQKSLHYLQKVLDSESPAFADEAYHYIGLAYLKMGLAEEAKQNLGQSTLEESKKLLAELNEK